MVSPRIASSALILAFLTLFLTISPVSASRDFVIKKDYDQKLTNRTASAPRGELNARAAKPSNWPTATQAGAAPTATRTSPADPLLTELSKSYNNVNNALYNRAYKGDMTHYAQSLGACGDTYNDASYTAAVSRLLYDTWPGAVAGQVNRNPICGPYVTGRRTINNAGVFVIAKQGPSYIDLGGDGLPNCRANWQCHVPLTATVKKNGKSVQVRIVDRCESCAIGDIDLTPTAFAALADINAGRTPVEWSFDKF